VDGLVLVAVGLPYWRDHDGPARWALLPFTQALAGLAQVWGVTPGWTFVGRQPAGVMRDWARTARTGRLGRIGQVDVEAALVGVTLPVLGVTVEHDRLTPPRTLDRLLARLPAAAVQRHHYTSSEAGGRVDHLRWARAGDALAARVARFSAAEQS
jgi:predicted alpha/beta hydrolase